MINKERLFKTFHDLAEISSPSRKEEAVSLYIARRLSGLNIETKSDNTEKITGANTGNLIVRIKGNGGAGQSVMFNAHMDTIEPTEQLKVIEDDKTIKTSGNSILGADDKAGIAVILEMIEVIKEKDIEHLPIEIIFTVSEEIGLFGANALDYPKINSKLAFCFDGGGKAGEAVMQAPTQEIIDVNFKGKAVHAGVEPEEGINAIYAACKAAADFPQGRLDEETTANLGTIEGGKATNIVAEKANFSAEVRSHNPEKLEKTIVKIEESAKKAASKTSAKVDIERKISFVGFRLEKDEEVTIIAKSAMAELGIEPVYTISGGGSDSNVFNSKGIKTLTLSMGARKAHSKEEYIEKEEFVKSAELALKIVDVATKRVKS
ncbi:MAG: M20/M25/M40 family metallo-hydrolase [Actinobacteria bacterium]|nr:MAG: M20/M25/M40 family metallo-hydrolase [Actinomycetota bacterium]